MRYCAEHGWLVGLSEPLPSDPHQAYGGKPPIIGCNHIVCSKCSQVVRHVDNRSVANPNAPMAQVEALFAAERPEEMPFLLSGLRAEGYRTYFCRCDWNDTSSAKWLDMVDQPWQCGGHPD